VKSILLGVFVAFALLAAGATAQSAPNTLGKIKAAKAINVAFSGDSLPFSYVTDGNKPAGYSIDLCQRVIAAISRAVGEPDLKVNWRVGSVSERLQMVASGKADMDCANTTMTQTRLKDVDFSNLIFADRPGRAGEGPRPLCDADRGSRGPPPSNG
jgi:glutamate/aspartate transport system substrate-binding protein